MKTASLLLLFSVMASLPTNASSDGSFYPQSFSDFQQKWGGNIPFPPEKLKDTLLSLDGDSVINAAILPHGRSLERSATDFEFPRTIMAWKSGQSSTPYFLFVGYTPSKSQLEIISWNWKTRQFDFSVVTDYAEGKKPKFAPANSFGCIACHQSGVPIFSQAPWSETNFDVRVAARIRSEAKDPFALSWFNSGWRQNLSPSDFDLDILDAGALAQIQGFCKDACGGDLVCRRQVLATSLVETQREGSAYDLYSSEELERRVASFKKVWPDDLFSFMSSEIPDRVLSSDVRSIAVNEDPLRIRTRTTAISPQSAIDYLFFRRYRGCWNFNRDQTSLINRLSRSQIIQAMQTEQMNSLVQTWIPSEQGIIAALNSAVSSPRTITSPEVQPWSSPKKLPRVVSDPLRPKKTTLALFNQYCASCHSGDENSQPPGLPLGDLNQLKTFIGTAQRSVKEMVNPLKPLMPPIGAPQPSLEEFEQLYLEMTK